MKAYCWNHFFLCKYRKKKTCSINIRCIYRHSDKPDPFWKREKLKKEPDQIIHSYKGRNVSRKRILDLIESGLTNQEIAGVYEVSEKAAANWVYRFKIKRERR